jgi:eukaryotic-like serine/threonine-protein kinase
LRHTTKDEPIEPRVHPASVAIGAEAPTAPPRAVGRYVMYGEIASGGMATVHFGRLVGPAGFARPVAIKRLRPQYASVPDFAKMFLDEARLAARIAHPNVVPTLDVVDTDGEVFLVMEYVRGATLSHLVRCAKQHEARFPAPISAGIVSAILQGLHAAHEATSDLGDRLELVHRDISPQNVLIGSDGVTRLLDFGIAKASGRLQTTRDGTLKGKLSYMAPEQVRNEAISPRTDLYAAAVILWELLTGKRLFHADSEVGTITRVLSAPVVRPIAIVPDLPPALDRLVVRGLERDPSKRFASAREMAAELSACLAVPSTVDIGEWVERTVGHDLRERAARVAAIERAAAEAVDPASGRDVVSGVKVSKRAAHAIARRDVIADAADHATQAEGKARSSLISSTDPGLSTDATASRTRKWMAVGSVSVALVIASAVGLSSLSRPRPNSRNIDEARDGVRGAVVAIAPSPPGSVAPPPAAALERPAEKPLVAPSSNSTGVATVAKSARTIASPAPTGARSVPGNSNVAAGADCSQPYTTDAKGHVHFKPSCI